jgi:3-oxoacyl-[acyl-carrier protein] reductase
MFDSVRGRSVIVTGASKGIGRGIALCFGAAGAKVMVVSRNAGEARGVVQEIAAAGGTAASFSADVTQRDDMQAMVDSTLDAFGAVHVLCANAGVFPAAKLQSMSEADFDAVIDTNLKGTFLSVQACLKPMQAQKFGRVILTSSITGPITGYPGWTHYGASKAGQLGFMRTAAIEVARFGITVNAIMPGNIATEGLSDMGPEYLRRMEAAIPMRRLGTVAEIGHAAVFLASDEAAYITGQGLVIDGGQTLPETDGPEG